MKKRVIKDENKTLTLKDGMQKAVCERLAEVMGVRFYGMRSGPGLRSSLKLKDEWSDTIPSQVDIVFVDREMDEVTLLSQLQRDMFFDMVMESTEDLDTVPIVEYVINETEKFA